MTFYSVSELNKMAEENQKITCRVCNCKDYPDCTVGENCCENCMDGGSGIHCKLDSNGDRIFGVLEDFEKCNACQEYFDPEDLKGGTCEKCEAKIVK